MQFLFSKINLFGGISPVGLSFAMARIYLDKNLIVVAFGYFLSKLIFFQNFNVFLVTVFELVVIALYYFAREFIKTKKQRFLLCVFVGLSSVLSLYFSFANTESLIFYFVNFFCEILLALYFCKFFSVYKTKFLFFKFSNLDYFVFSLMVLMLSMGLFSFGVVEKYLGLFVVSIFVVFVCKMLPAEKYFVLSSMIALGAVVIIGDYIYLIFTTLACIVFVNFKDLNKYLYGVVATLLFTVFVFIFQLFNIFSYFSLIFAIFFYLVVPNKFVLRFSNLFEQDAMNLICTELQNSRILMIKEKLQIMSDTFLDMQKNFTYLMVGKINRESACIELAQDVINKCCKNCENFRFCFTQNINKRAMFESLLFKAVENKQVSKEDVGNGMLSYCMKSGIVINEINQTAKMFLSYEQAMKTEDSSKLLISSELGNFSDIFSNFAKMVKYSIKINKNSSKIIKESCLNNLIELKEVVVLENESGIESVNVIADNELLLRREILVIAEKVIKNRLKLSCLKHLNLSGVSMATFVPASRFRIEFAVSSKAKEEQNGDNVMISKLSENKYFIAIADGMGHGENANRISSMVLSLIKSMFEVGLDDELILQSVNKLLLPAGLDNFTTLDACVIDLENEICNFIKLGSSVSVMKHKETSENIVCDSLPMGIVQNIKPTIIKKHISYGDLIFLASDGIVDSFPSVDAYRCFINDSKIYNLQKYVDSVVLDASFQNSKHPDDMTIIAINLLKNC